MGAPRAGRKPSLEGIAPEVAEGLQHLGLTAYEIKVYTAILHHPRSRVPEIARYSSVPQPKVYATLKRLIERGLCESHLGPINQYSALEPSDAFHALLEESVDRQKDAVRAIEVLAKQHSQATQGLSRREGRIKMFQGRAAAQRNYKFLVQQSESSIITVARLPMLALDDDEVMHERLEAGVNVKHLIEVPNGISDRDQASLEHSKKNGAEIKRIKKVPMRMGIFDSKITILPMLDPAAGQGDGFVMLEVRNHGLSEGFATVFQMLWDAADDF